MKFLQFLSKCFVRERKKRAKWYRPELHYMRGRQVSHVVSGKECGRKDRRERAAP